MDTSDATELLLELAAKLGPELTGYPVSQLLDAFVAAPDQDRITAYRLMDRCLANWIEQLGRPLMSEQGGWSEALEGIQRRQLGTRNALMRFQATLSRVDLLRPSRGRLC